MSEGEPKSAFEIAMEKLRARGDFPEARLTEEQKAEIAEIRGRHKAKVAELEIHHQSDLRKAMDSEDFEQLEKLKETFAREKERLNQEVEEQVRKVRETKK